MILSVLRFIDDLEMALVLMTNLPPLFTRLEDKQKNILLQTILKRLIINPQGEIISYELHSPFAYLVALTNNFLTKCEEGCSSEQVCLGAPAHNVRNLCSNHSQKAYLVVIARCVFVF